MPSTNLCRGCGGNGLAHTLSPREMQYARQPFFMVRGSSTLHLQISEEHGRGRLSFKGPLAEVLAEIKRRTADDWTIPTAPEPIKDWACSWCFGTGQPNLSSHTMEMAVRA